MKFRINEMKKEARARREGTYMETLTPGASPTSRCAAHPPSSILPRPLSFIDHGHSDIIGALQRNPLKPSAVFRAQIRDDFADIIEDGQAQVQARRRRRCAPTPGRFCHRCHRSLLASAPGLFLSCVGAHGLQGTVASRGRSSSTSLARMRRRSSCLLYTSPSPRDRG